MITQQTIAIKESRILVELVGLSTDTKPTKVDNYDVCNGSTFFEMNTSKAFMFNQDTQSWVEL